jgi:hypothetical protein
VIPANATALADKSAKNPRANFRIIVDHPQTLLREYRVEFLDLGIFEKIQIVAECRFKRSGVLSHQFEH